MTPRALEIRKDLENLRKREYLAGPDYIIDWIAEEIERDEIGGFWEWPSSKKKPAKGGKKGGNGI